MMTIYGQDNTVVMQVSSLERRGADLVMKGKVFGTLPITAKLTPREGRNALKLLNVRLIVFLLSFLLRK
jgi:hypothetical protein